MRVFYKCKHHTINKYMNKFLLDPSLTIILVSLFFFYGYHCCIQGLHWQEAGIRHYNQKLNPSIPALGCLLPLLVSAVMILYHVHRTAPRGSCCEHPRCLGNEESADTSQRRQGGSHGLPSQATASCLSITTNEKLFLNWRSSKICLLSRLCHESMQLRHSWGKRIGAA